MCNLYKEAGKITNNNIILAVPLIICLKIIDLYSFYSRTVADSIPKQLLASITLVCMFAVFASGWLYMVKKAVEFSKKIFVLESDRVNASLSLFKVFPEGIGKYFLSFVGVDVFLFFFQVLMLPFVLLLGVKLIGLADEATLMQFQQMFLDPAFSSNASMSFFVDKLTEQQIIFFAKWSLYLMVCSSIFMYFFMFWVPEIMYVTKNPVYAFGKSFVRLLKNFKHSIMMYLSMWFVGFVLLFINTFSFIGPIIYLIISVLMFYSIMYFVVLLFLYYDKKFVGEDVEKK